MRSKNKGKIRLSKSIGIVFLLNSICFFDSVILKDTFYDLYKCVQMLGGTEDKRLSEFSLIPREEFTALGSVANNLLDKLEKTCGWLVQL